MDYKLTDFNSKQLNTLIEDLTTGINARSFLLENDSKNLILVPYDGAEWKQFYEQEEKLNTLTQMRVIYFTALQKVMDRETVNAG